VAMPPENRHHDHRKRAANNVGQRPASFQPFLAAVNQEDEQEGEAGEADLALHALRSYSAGLGWGMTEVREGRERACRIGDSLRATR
jgi:hypothetical protein